MKIAPILGKGLIALALPRLFVIPLLMQPLVVLMLAQLVVALLVVHYKEVRAVVFG